MNRINIQNQRGFTLIEALFSAIVLGIGILALAGFHAVALQDGTLVKMRMVATSLAQEKLDDLKSFSRLMDDPATTGVDECGAGTFCYTEIAENAGGQEDGSGNLLIASGSITPTDAGTSYTRTWTSVCYSETAGAAPSVNTACTDADFKLVTVIIAWTDNKGTPREIRLQAVIYGLDPSNVARAAANPAASPGPKVSYTPIGVPDAVPVPISTGDGKYKESSKPLPDVSSKGYSLRTEFDAVSYTTAGGSTKKDSQLEFATVNCVCEFTGSGSGYPASYFYWDGNTLQIQTPSAMVAKMTGTAPSINGDPQDSLCDTCCRDHHDSEAPNASSPTTALYDPERPAADYTGNNHKHYYYVDAGDPDQGLVEVAESNGNRYLEACRFARVDGIYRLLQDWRALDVVVMPYDNYLSVDATLEAYQDYLIDYLEYQARIDCTSAGGTDCTNITQSSAPSKSDLATRNLSGQTPGTYNQLLARALYSDRVYSKTAPRTLDATYYTGLAAKVAANASWLDRLPFNEVNVTLLANWASSDTSVVTVTNEEISDIEATTADYYGVYSRGLTLIKSGNGGSANISAYLLPSNSGLTGGVQREPIANVVDYDSNLAASGTIAYAGPIGIDPDDHRSGQRETDSLNIARASTFSTTLVSGDLRVGNSSATLAASTDVTLSASPSTGVSCTVGAPVAGVATYTCTVSSSYTGTLSASTGATGGFFDVGASGDTTYDTESATVPESTCDITSGTINSACQNFWVFGPTANVLGKCNGGKCDSASVDVVSKLNGTGADVACTISGTVITCPVTLDTTTKTWTGTFKITNKSGQSNYLSASSTCSTSDGTGSKTTSSVSAGPQDKQSAFDVCATAAVAVAPAAPNPGWVGTNPKTLSWSAVSGATGYKVYTCTTTNKNSLTACSPGTQDGGTQAGTTYNPGIPGTKDTICVAVKSTDGTLDSDFSSTKCIYLNASGSTYSYQ